MRQLLSSLVFLFVTFTLQAQEPARKALLGATGTFSEEGMKVDSIVPGSTLAAAGLKKGDVLVTVNNKHIKSAQQYYAIATDIRAGEKISITYTRNSAEKAAMVKAVARPFETSESADVYYDWVPYKQCSLRAVTRKPKTIKKGPAVLLIPGYNCGSVENFSTGIYKHLIDSWLNNGFIVVTVEKSGLGDSYNCKPCSQVDLVTDMQTFDAAYKYMEALPYADKNNLFIWGHSMGGVIAPEIARRHKPKGVVVFATVFRPWAEFLPEMHRVQFPLDGHSYTKTEQDVRMIHRIYDDFFNKKKTVEELYQVPEYKELVRREFGYEKGNEDLWGRHYRYWQQIDSFDMAAAWSGVQCPVLSVFGGADFIACSELEHQLIERTVNSVHPGNCTHITIPDIDHLLLKNKDWKEAHDTFKDRSTWPDKFHFGFTEVVNKWMKEQTAD